MTESISQLVAAHRAGRSPADTMRAVYRRIRAHDDPALFIGLRPEDETVAEAERLAETGDPALPLYGVPFAVKDNIDVGGLPTTAACPGYAYRPERSAHVVSRLVAAGAIPVGKTNLDQFATGLVGVRSPYGVPRNAVDPALVPGGSSSGSASAVAAGIVPFSLGTDTAGSGRVPAAFNRIVGLKPTRGLLSAAGVVPACRSLDCVSIFARDVADALAVLEVAAGYDPADAWSRPVDLLPGGLPERLVLGVPDRASRVFCGDGAAEAAFDAALAAFERMGAEIVAVDPAPFHETARLLYEGPWVAERTAAIRGFLAERPEAVHPVTRAIIEGGLPKLAVDTFEAFYRLAELRRVTEPVWHGIDALVLPTTPTIYTVEEVLADPVETNTRLGTYTNFVNLLDLCGLAVPGPDRADGRPAGVTLLAPAGQDRRLATIGARYEAALAGRASEAGPGGAIPAGTVEVAVFGAHLSGMALNRELRALEAVFVRAAETAPDYRLYRLDGAPPRPGLIRVGAGEGAPIAAEVWAMTPAAFGRFVAGIAAPLGIGTVRLAGDGAVKGFLAEAEGVHGAEDITAHGGWRAYREAAAE